MWSSLAFAGALALAPGQVGDLALDNVRLTYGRLGTERPDENVLPGDVVYVTFDISNIKVDEVGYVNYSMTMEVFGPDGKKILESKPGKPSRDFLPLGGNTLPGHAFVQLGADQAPGEYSCKLTVTDNIAKATDTLTQKFTVVRKRFGIVAVASTSDPNADFPSPMSGFSGESLWVHFCAIHFQRDRTKDQPDVEFQMTVLDEDGRPTVKKPTLYEVNKDVGEKETLIRMRLPVPMNRPGKYVIVIKATDRVGRTSDTIRLPLYVVARQ